MLNKFSLAALGAFALCCSQCFAQTKTKDLPEHTIVYKDDAGWHKISEFMINDKPDSTPAPVRGLHKYRAFRLYATDGPVHVESVKIFYENGVVTDTTFNLDLKPGVTSKQFKINNSVMVRGIVYKCHSLSTSKKPHLWLYGFI
jgi:hypothetical protein